MRNCKEFVKILESYLKEKGLSRKQFCEKVEIPNSTVASWKAKNVLPSIEFVNKIAQFMNVSLDWLVNGEITKGADNSNKNPYSPQLIAHRIEEAIRDKFRDFDRQQDEKNFHDKYLKDIVDFDLYNNWRNGKAYLPLKIFVKIADKAAASLQFLLTGIEVDQNNLDPHAQKIYKKYMSTLFNLDCLDEDKQKIYIELIAESFELQRLRQEKK